VTETESSSQDARRQHLVLALVAASRTSAGAIFGPAVTVYIGRAAPPLAATPPLATFSLGLLVFAPVWGAIADVTGRRKLVLVGTALGSALTVAPLAVTVSVPLEIASRGLYAVFIGGFGSVILTIVSETGGDSARGRSIGFYTSAQAGGDIIGRLLVGYLLGVLFPTELYLVVVVVGLLTTVCSVFVVDPTPTPEGAATVESVLAEMRTRLVPRGARQNLFRTKGLGWLYVGLVLRNTTQKGVSSVLPVFLVADVGLSEFVMGVVLAVSPAVRLVAMYALGRLSDAIGRKWLIVAGLGGAGGQALVGVAALLPATMVLRAVVSGSALLVHALTFSALTIGTIAFIGDVAPADRESELMGLRSTARGLGGVIGPLIVGGLATYLDYASAFVAISVLSFLAAGLVARTLVESHGEPAAAVPTD
jgi:MFS family permease